MFYQILILVVVFVGSYLIGSIPNGVWIGKLFFKKDIRQFGSKNSGGTNAGRVLGKKIGLLVIILDFLKTIVPFWISYFVLTYTPLVDVAWMPVSYYLAIFGAAVGHCWPIYVGFKGGKAVSAFCACILCVNWFVFVCGLVVFFIILKIKKYVSLSSLIASLFGVILCWLTLIPQIGF